MKLLALLLLASWAGLPMAAEDNLPILGGVPLVGFGAPAILSIFFIMFMRGDIMPRRAYKDLMQDRDYWRQAHSTSEEARQTALKQVDVLVEGFRTVDAIAEGIRKAAGRPD